VKPRAAAVAPELLHIPRVNRQTAPHRSGKGDSAMSGLQSALAAIARVGSAWQRSLIWSSLLVMGRMGDFLSPASTPNETAYYVNPAVQALARMSGGVRLPAGQWTRVAGDEIATSQAERIVRRQFPGLSAATLYVFTMHTDLDVEDFERCFGLAESA
jgi:hypothetical protein